MANVELENGRHLKHGEYRIERVLGQGGFGITYEALQVSLNRKVAVKEFFMREFCCRDEASHVSFPSEGGRETVSRFRTKFIKEAQIIASLNHPNIIRIHDVFEDNGTAYYVMDLLSGGPISDKISNAGHLSIEVTLNYIRQISEALKYIHSHQLNHLDVKPSNMIIDESGNVILVDFGLSKRYDSDGNQTSSTPVGVSHGYAPMEQYKDGGVKDFSPSTDIYSLGASMYKMLTGQTPPQAIEVFQDGLPEMDNSIPAYIRSAIIKSMQPRHKDRPQSVGEFLQLLEYSAEDIVTGSREQCSHVIETEKQTLPYVQHENLPEASSDEPDSSDESTMMFNPSHQQATLVCTDNGHEWVDLGLSVKWATCNVGAEKPEEYGNYFAWGETSPKREYGWNNYIHCHGIIKKFLKYNRTGLGIRDNDNKNVLELSDDAARANWGGSWRMPTDSEFQELVDKCTWTWSKMNGKEGYKVTSKVNGNSIFLPAAGCRTDTNLSYAGSYGSYWSSSLDESGSDFARDLFFYSDDHNTYYNYRYNGHSVRPVLL